MQRPVLYLIHDFQDNSVYTRVNRRVQLRVFTILRVTYPDEVKVKPLYKYIYFTPFYKHVFVEHGCYNTQLHSA